MIIVWGVIAMYGLHYLIDGWVLVVCLMVGWVLLLICVGGFISVDCFILWVIAFVVAVPIDVALVCLITCH